MFGEESVLKKIKIQQIHDVKKYFFNSYFLYKRVALVRFRFSTRAHQISLHTHTKKRI